MKKIIITLLILLSITALYFYLTDDFEKAPPTVYINANIITLNEKQPKATAMLVVDGKIKSIGQDELIETSKFDHVETVDLKGATIMPGFIDVHTHFALSMFFSDLHDLSGFKHQNNKEVWAHFEELAKNTAPNEWIICKGMDPILVNDLTLPTLKYLDEIAPDNPVVIFSQSLHSYWVNTKAFEKAGITTDTKGPSKESYYEKDTDGNFTGLIVEQEAFQPFIELLKEEVLTPQVLSEVSGKVMREYAKNGNTTIVSTGLTINDSKPLILLKYLSDEHPSLLGGFLEKIGQFPVRKPTPRHFMYLRHDMADLLPEKKDSQNDFYNFIGIKHWYDGSPYVGSMYMDSAYLDTELTSQTIGIPKGSSGKALINKDDLKKFITHYHENGWQIAFHTQGDAAIKEVVTAFEELETTLNYSKSRHRLEHCLMLPSAEIPRIKKLNLSPSFHINHLYYYGDALKSDMLGEARTATILPINSVIQSGITATLHADQPMFESKPFRLIQTAVERKTKTGVEIGNDEKLELIDAIKALTVHAAWQINMEDKLGSLEEGKYADFLILNKDPFKVATEELHQIECVETFIHGNKVK